VGRRVLLDAAGAGVPPAFLAREVEARLEELTLRRVERAAGLAAWTAAGTISRSPATGRPSGPIPFADAILPGVVRYRLPISASVSPAATVCSRQVSRCSAGTSCSAANNRAPVPLGVRRT
jgi:hypothetical protein